MAKLAVRPQLTQRTQRDALHADSVSRRSFLLTANRVAEPAEDDVSYPPLVMTCLDEIRRYVLDVRCSML